jgi:hypothetical protein
LEKIFNRNTASTKSPGTGSFRDANPKLIKEFMLQKFTCKIYVADDKRVFQLKHKNRSKLT